MASLTAVLITCNWTVYVWAVAVGRTLETALGYYINPLLNVAIGAIVLRERLAPLQMIAVGLAVAAVALLTVESGGLPWVSLALAGSFAGYGFFKKTLPIDPTQGFLLEVLLLCVPALGYIGWLAAIGEGHFTPAAPGDFSLLLLAGPVTAAPLLLFGAGAKRLRFSTIGIMQYVAPTMIFLTAVFVFGEPFGWTEGTAFAMIWLGLALYTWSLLWRARAG
jgi:chloramphenicol-sensitive protein RarD